MMDALEQLLWNDEFAPGADVRWVSQGEWSPLQEGFAIGLVVLILAITAWNLRRVAGWHRKVGFFLLRLGLVGVLLFAFYEPAMLEETRALSTNAVVILVDDSASMALPHKEGTRRDQVGAYLGRLMGAMPELAKASTVEAWRFATGTAANGPSDGSEGAPSDGDDELLVATELSRAPKELLAAGETTPILETLEALQRRYKNRDVGGIVLISDGIDTGRAGRTFGRGGVGLDGETVRLLQSFGAPIHTVGYSVAGLSDIAVRELRSSPFAFKRTLTSLEADVEVVGYEAGELEIELLEDGRLVKSVIRSIESGKRTYTASFEFVPTEIGFRVYSIRVKPLAGELTTENNVRHTVVRVNRDKVRVLQIAGHPSWDVRFLRNHLKRAPNVQLVSFFILVSATSVRAVSQQETALIPFPAEELFVEELGSFDVVIFQDFNYGPFSTPEHLPAIAKWVKEGGAFLFVGGRLAFGAGNYDGTPIEELLPVEMVVPGFGRTISPSRPPSTPPSLGALGAGAAPEVASGALDAAEFKAQLTEAGRRHAITQLAVDPSASEALWRAFPPLEGANLFSRLKPGALSLVAHERLVTDDGTPMPIIAAGEPGKGRVVTIGTDSLWRWKMPAVEQGGDGTLYDTLIDNTLRWLIRDPGFELVKVSASSGVYALGEKVRLDVRVTDPSYEPAVGMAVSVRLHRRPSSHAGAPAGVGDDTDSTLVFESTGLETGQDGRVTLERLTDEPGIYDVTARAVIAGREITGSTVYVVADERPELREVRPDAGLLRAISAATGGSHRDVHDAPSGLTFRPPRVTDVTSRVFHDRWNSPFLFAFVCILLTLDWSLRRRAGLA
ncbi:MAG: hypothetical protein IV100_04295 [Myxococcales bacterium]|nr:hypothetical protein [Myxococcales bacterium]